MSAPQGFAKKRHYPSFRCVGHTDAVTVATSLGGDFRVPFGGTIESVSAYTNDAGVTGTQIVDINKNGSTILSTKITIDTGEKSSEDATTPPVLSVTTIAKDDIITIDSDQIHSGTAANGLSVMLKILSDCTSI